MICIPLLVVLASSVCGMFVVKTTLYQAEENDNVTIKWDSQTKTDMCHINILCVLQSKPMKVFYQMIKGAEVPESQDEQFAGRVQCDEDALREGRLRLHLSRVTTDDLGNYRCDLVANYDKIMKRWVIEASEHFVLNVTQTPDGGSRDVFLTTPGRTGGAKHTPGGPKKEEVRYDWKKVKTALGAANCGILIVAGLMFLVGLLQDILRQFIC